MDNEPDNVTLTIRLPETMKQALQDKAKAEDLTVSQLIRRHFAATAAPARRRKPRTHAAV